MPSLICGCAATDATSPAASAATTTEIFMTWLRRKLDNPAGGHGRNEPRILNDLLTRRREDKRGESGPGGRAPFGIVHHKSETQRIVPAVNRYLTGGHGRRTPRDAVDQCYYRKDLDGRWTIPHRSERDDRDSARRR